MTKAARDPPPARALRWVETAAGPGARVVRAHRLTGGKSSAVHALDVTLPSGSTHRLVLRRFVDADWLAQEPDTATHEAAVLHLLAGSNLPTPRLIAADADGALAGLPSVLMTRLPGRVQLQPSNPDAWLAPMAALLPQIHVVSPSGLSWAYSPYTEPRDVEVPAWTSRPDAWHAIVDFAREPRPPAPIHLIHRDYHPTNILWQRGRITGIVDWVNACRGPAGVDIGHCRRNLALLHSVEVADRFLAFCLEWGNYNPYWDIVSLLDAEFEAPVYNGWLDLGVMLPATLAHTRLDEYATSLASRL